MNNKRDSIDLIVSTAELTSVFDKKSSLSTLLQDITSMVAHHMSADVCSIYLYDEDNEELVLRATVGLSPSSVDNVKLKLGEGITGLALKELRPVREARASKNPGFKAFEGINEERYEAFIAVPIKKGLKRIGVITLQHRQPDYFSKRDTSALKAIASQLAASIENSQLLMHLSKDKKRPGDFTNLRIKGNGEFKAVTSGKAYLLNAIRKKNRIAYEKLTSEEQINGCTENTESDEECVALDEAAFDKAVELSMRQLEELQFLTDKTLSDVAGMIFTAHFLMLRDDNFTGKMRDLITKGNKPDEAVSKIAYEYSGIFENSDQPGVREKAQDVRDLEHRLLANLYGEKFSTADYSSNIIIASDIYPSELVKLWLQKARGLVLYGSSVTGHISILARSLSFPLFITADRKIFSIPQGTELLLDNFYGYLYINPSEDIKTSYQSIVATEYGDAEEEIPDLASTKDGVKIAVQANINITHDIDTAIKLKAEGIGLYRSEFPFIIRNEFPSEEEQYRIYRKILSKAGNLECVLRTLDIGGDKIPGSSDSTMETNPFLGFRGIRFSLGNIEIFQEQVRAMLRAGEGYELKIMFPMVSSMDEFNSARRIISETVTELKKDEIPANYEPKVGAMVELPAAVEIIKELSAAADFLSIGTNDLIMYTLAVDRTNEKVKHLYRSCHPAILRSISRVAFQALRDGTEISVCGEAASEPGILRFLLGLGIKKISADPLNIPAVKRMIGSVSIDECREFSAESLKAETLEEAEKIFLRYDK